ncbi:hypothetical protein WJX73_007399 [Symbiochloris irregularis]|uniref:Uncharacterized protein n=1 Tax=Symbiochloris irregularis TaxID=706552 RepID=A0AAW1NP10_9CHLO
MSSAQQQNAGSDSSDPVQQVKAGILPGTIDSDNKYHSVEHDRTQQKGTYSPLGGAVKQNDQLQSAQGAYATPAEHASSGAGVNALGKDEAAQHLQNDFRAISEAGQKSSGADATTVPNTVTGTAASDAVLQGGRAV